MAAPFLPLQKHVVQMSLHPQFADRLRLSTSLIFTHSAQLSNVNANIPQSFDLRGLQRNPDLLCVFQNRGIEAPRVAGIHGFSRQEAHEDALPDTGLDHSYDLRQFSS
ncbi:hypothetical protein [Nannocystis exedens]|uniref:hypothetical protein n=1 Tax=Nannocystis exedens TaxID=54 RepID=UPI001FEA205C|nr:hypothetical protein [Nannocystis exedens]